jgi:hypothetical protein
MGVPFGFKKRDLAGEVMRAISASHDPKTCPVCSDIEALKAIYADHGANRTLIVLLPPEPCETGDRGPWCEGCGCRYE